MNEYEDRWRELSKAVCVERGEHNWHSWRGGVRCFTCQATGTVETDRRDDEHEPNEASRGY